MTKLEKILLTLLGYSGFWLGLISQIALIIIISIIINHIRSNKSFYTSKKVFKYFTLHLVFTSISLISMSFLSILQLRVVLIPDENASIVFKLIESAFLIMTIIFVVVEFIIIEILQKRNKKTRAQIQSALNAQLALSIIKFCILMLIIVLDYLGL